MMPRQHPVEAMDLRDAAARIAGHARLTPVLRSSSIDALAGCTLFFKAENLQRGGAFKFRGAANAVFALDPATAARGVVTQSSGNHGAAVALACRLRDIPCTVVVPTTAARIKRQAIARHGARIIDCEFSQAARDAATAAALASSGATLVHPFDDPLVIAGQGTATLELLAQLGEFGAAPADRPVLDAILAPLSGGGLASGMVIAAAAHDPRIRGIAVEPSGAADGHDALASGQRQSGRIANTVCDGLRAELGQLPFAILRQHRTEVLLVDDADTLAALRLLLERMKLLVEPSAAIVLAALLRHRQRFAGQRVGLLLSGGNVDLDQLSVWFDQIAAR